MLPVVCRVTQLTFGVARDFTQCSNLQFCYLKKLTEVFYAEMFTVLIFTLPLQNVIRGATEIPNRVSGKVFFILQTFVVRFADLPNLPIKRKILRFLEIFRFPDLF